MVVQNNLHSLNAYNKLNVNVTGLNKSSEKLSSGYRINRAGDDAAGLAMSEKMRSQLKGLTQGVKNIQDGINLLQTADGALSAVHDMIHRLSQLSEQSANGSYSLIERESIQQEVDQILEEIDQTSDYVIFNSKSVFGGSGSSASKTASAVSAAVSDATAAVTSENTPQPTTRSSLERNNAAMSALVADASEETDFTPLMAMNDNVLKVRSYATAPLAANVTQCGDLTVTGGTLGTDFKYENNTLTILTSTAVEISGTTTKDRIVVEKDKNANITLNDLNITTGWAPAFSIADDSTGNVKLTLKGTNSLTATDSVALRKNGGASSGTLTIGGDGELTAKSGNGAGIGSADNNTSGAFNIVINSGTIYANSTYHGAGIGGGENSEAGNITINGGTIEASSRYDGAGIGGGKGGKATNITINDGNVKVSGRSGAGIGGGSDADASDIKINGGHVEADSSNGAGIGSGCSGKADNITISAGTVEVITEGGSGIGSGIRGKADNITISGGDIKATVRYGYRGSGIGSGQEGELGKLTISGGKISVKGWDGTAIGSGERGKAGSITITGGEITAEASTGAAIGSGRYADIDSITISGGKINVSNDDAAGIGSGENGKVGSITINGGVIKASSRDGAAIGSGGSGYVGSIIINGGTISATAGDGAGIGNGRRGGDSTATKIEIRGSSTVVYASGGKTNIGAGEYNSGPTPDVKRYSGLIIEGKVGYIYGGDVTIKDDFTIVKGVYVHVDGERTPENSHSLTIDNGVTLTNNGTIHVYLHDKLPINGTVVNNGLIIYEPEVPADTDNISGGGTVKGQDPSATPEPPKPDNPVDPNPNPDPPNPPDPPGPDKPDPPGPGKPDKPGGNTPGGSNGTGSGSGYGSDSGVTEWQSVWQLQVGTRTKDTLSVEIGAMNTKILGINGLDVSDQESANRAVDITAEALNKISTMRSTIGAQQNRLEHKLSNTVNVKENLTQSESSIRDTEMAAEVLYNTKYKILLQASQIILMQANEVPQSTLQLLG